jgi:hypothetical protein
MRRRRAFSAEVFPGAVGGASVQRRLRRISLGISAGCGGRLREIGANFC